MARISKITRKLASFPVQTLAPSMMRRNFSILTLQGKIMTITPAKLPEGSPLFYKESI
jgi:hypothetical protein